MYKVIKISESIWDGGDSTTDKLVGYFSVPKGWSLLEEGIARFVAEYWNKVLFHRVLGVYRPIGLGYPDNVSGLNIDVIELKEKPFNVGNLIDKNIRERLAKISPHNTDEIGYNVGFKDSIFGILNTDKLSNIEEGILTNPEFNFNYAFENLWKINILLVELIQATSIRPTWFDDYLKLMTLINSNTKFKKFRETKWKNVMYVGGIDD